jgi:hypothetical protein
LSEIQDLQNVLRRVPDNLLDLPRALNVFVFRDWWSIFERWMHELISLRNGIIEGKLAHAPERARSTDETLAKDD